MLLWNPQCGLINVRNRNYDDITNNKRKQRLT